MSWKITSSLTFSEIRLKMYYIVQNLLKVMNRRLMFLRHSLPASYLSSNSMKAETHYATNRTMRPIAATRRRYRLLQQIASCDVKIFVAATEFCRCHLSHEFKLVFLRRKRRTFTVS